MSSSAFTRRGRRFAPAMLATLLGAALPAQAQVWDGSDSVDFRDGNNWVGGVAPTPGATIVITGPAVEMPVIDGGTVIANLLYVGQDTMAGGAILDLVNGAALTTTAASIGEAGNNNAGNALEDDDGGVILEGVSSWATDRLSIGTFGIGTVAVTDGSSLDIATSLQLGVAANAGSNPSQGVLGIIGAGSQATSAGTAVLGVSGLGAIVVYDQAWLLTNATTLGQGFDGYGVIDVLGPGSHWGVQSGPVVIGDNGLGSVFVSYGATASTLTPGGAGSITLGQGFTGSGIVEVFGAGSRLDAGEIRVGEQGQGGLTVGDGGIVSATHLLLGAGTTGEGVAMVTGQRSLLRFSNLVTIGDHGYGQLVLNDGGILYGPGVRIAEGAGSYGILGIGGLNGTVAPGIIDVPNITFGAGDGILGFSHNATDYVFEPNLIGRGEIIHRAGMTTFTGNGALFTGSTALQGGQLRILNTLGGTVNVTGGTLAGSGTVGTTTIAADGRVAPEGVLSVAGDLTFKQGSYYLVDAEPRTNDSIKATGSVTIEGGTVQHQAAAGPFNWQDSFRILSAGAGLNGTFSGVTSALAFLDPRLDYTIPNEVWLTLSRNNVAFETVALTPNQRQVGQVLSGLPGTNPLVRAMLVLTEGQARNALDQLAGDTHSTLQGANLSLARQVQDLAATRLRQAFAALGRGNPVSNYASAGTVELDDDRPVEIWLQGLGDHARVDPTSGAGGLNSGSGGLVAGMDTLVSGVWRVGVMGGYSGSAFSAIDRPASGTAQNLHAGLYAGAALDAVRLQASALLTWHGLTTRRDVAFGGLADTLTASYGAQTSQVFGEAGYVFDLGAVEIEPFGSLSYALTNTGGFVETGGPAALTSLASTNDAVTTVLGTRLEAPFAVDDTLVTARAMIGWQHQNGVAPASQFSLAGSAPFAISGASFSGDALVYEAGVAIDLSTGLNLDLVYSGQLASSDFRQAIKGVLAAQF